MAYTAVLDLSQSTAVLYEDGTEVERHTVSSAPEAMQIVKDAGFELTNIQQDGAVITADAVKL